MSSTTASSPATSPAWNIGLWIFQVLLAFMMLGAGAMKAIQPLEGLAEAMPWVGQVPWWVTRLSGVSEVIGAVGLIVPAATRILPVLTPIASALLALVMVLAVVMHGALGEFGAIVPPLVLAAIFSFVAWGRFLKAPIASRL
jgi:putative oxidoreductase